MTRRALVVIALIASCALTMGAGWLSGPRFGPGVGAGFAPVAAVVAQADTRVAWNADPDCVYFDGDDLASGSATGMPVGNFTAMFWLYDSNYSTAGNDYPISWGAAPTANFNIGLGYPSANTLLFASDGAYKSYSCTRSAAWKHYAIVASTTFGSVKVYQDGVLKNSVVADSGGDSKTIVISNTFLNLGTSTSNYFTGKVAELAFFNAQKTQSEIQAMYPYKLTGSESGLVRLYHCDEGSGTTLTDACGSGHNLTLIGATWSTK